MKNHIIKITMPAEIILNRDISANQKILLALIKSHRGTPTPMSFEYLAEWLGVTPSAACQMVNDLMDKGFIKRKKLESKSYLFTIPKEVKKLF